MKNTLLSLAMASVALSTTAAIAQDDLVWSGRANVGGFVTDGNVSKKAATGDAMVKARNTLNRYEAGAEARYASDEGVETENEHQAYANYDRFLSDKLFVGGGLNYESDKIAAIDHRLRVGPHIGYQFYESDPLNLSTRVGVEYIDEKFTTGNTENSAGASWGLDYDQRFLKDAVQVFYKHMVTVPFDEVDGFLYDGQTGVRFPVAKVLTGTAQVDFDWDNAPEPGVKEADVTYAVKIGYEF